MNKTLIKEIVFVLIAVVIFVDLTIFFSNKIILNSPTGYSTNTLPEFIWKSNLDEYQLIVDNVDDFSSPEVNVKTESNYYKLTSALEPGIYYWKVLAYSDKGIIESNVRSFIIQSKVAVSIKNIGSEYELVNEGNVLSNVNVIEENNEGLGIVGAVVLDVGQNLKRNISNKTVFEVSQK